MTVPNQRRDVPWVLNNHDERILRLERERSGSYYGFGFEMARELLRPADFANYYTEAGGTVAYGAYGGTSALMTLADALGEEAVFAMRLGPTGAMYHLQFLCQTGPDCGVFEFQWAQVPDAIMDGDGWNDGADPLGGTGLLLGPTEIDWGSLNWLTIPDWSGIGDPGDLYSAAPADNQNGGGGGGGSPGSRFSQFRILGSPGDVATTMAASGGGGYTFAATDGGPGIWLLRVLVIDQNPASAGFAIRMSSLTVQREFIDNNSV